MHSSLTYFIAIPPDTLTADPRSSSAWLTTRAGTLPPITNITSDKSPFPEILRLKRGSHILQFRYWPLDHCEFRDRHDVLTGVYHDIDSKCTRPTIPFSPIPRRGSTRKECQSRISTLTLPGVRKWLNSSVLQTKPVTIAILYTAAHDGQPRCQCRHVSGTD